MTPKNISEIGKLFEEKLGTYTNEYGYVHNIPNLKHIKLFLTSTIIELLSSLRMEKIKFPKLESDDYEKGYANAVDDLDEKTVGGG